MLTSTETRWILTSNEVAIVEKWFGLQGEKFLKLDYYPRQDFYLKTDSKSVGIKIREPKNDTDGNIIAKLELKTLTNDNGTQKFNNQNTGLVNTWVKFSFDIDTKTNPIQLIHSKIGNQLSKEWILIEKDRLLTKYDAINKKIISSKEIINCGAGIELTKFLYNNIVYYTLGIEAFNSEGETESVFYETIQFLFNNVKISGLDHRNSKTYPEILLQLK